MKKIFPIIILALITFSCQKEPDVDKLDSNFVVSTNHDKDFSFSSSPTYYIPDSVMIISKKEKPDYWIEKNSEQIIKALTDNMDERGFVRTDVKADASLGVQVSYVEDVSYFSDYNSGSNWWWGYPGYWSPGYWGGGWYGGWYYPYPVVYQYNVGSLLVEIIDLEGTTDKLPVRWTAYMSGLLYGSKFNTALAVNAINQAFTQSPYLKK